MSNLTIESNINQFEEVRLKIRVPRQYHQDSILFKLVSEYKVEINILAALLAQKGDSDGWFDILLKGNKKSIDDALFYLSELDIEILNLERLDDGL
jgi:hypothetical protein